MAATPQRHRAFKSNLTVSFGVVTFQVDLIPPRNTGDDTTFESACPTCHTNDPAARATKLSVSYRCPLGHGPFSASETLKAAADDNVMRVIGTNAEVRAAKDGVDPTPNQLVLRPFYAEEVEANTYPIGTAYVLVQKGRSAGFPLLLSLLDHAGHLKGEDGRGLVLIGEVTLRESRKLVQIRRWNDLLVIQELARPDDLKSGFAVCADPADERFLAPVTALMSAEAKVFDPNEFLNPQRKRLQEFTTARLAGTVTVVAPAAVTTTAPEDSDVMLRLLTRSVAKARKAAPGARKTPARKAS